jgi:branched-chain amino acid transport system permease protein
MSVGVRRASALAAIAVALIVFALFPVVFTDPQTTSIAVFTLIFMVSTCAWNIFSGYSGYLALGHAVFFGCGGYAVALAARDWHVPGGWAVFALLPFGGLVAALIAIPVGVIALRVRRHTFVVVTIAIFFIFQLAAFNFAFTGGTSGILLPLAPFSAANYNQPFYYVALVILVLTVALSWAVRRSRFGLQLLAIRDDEDRARGLGVKTWWVKLAAFVISAFPVGMVGGLYFYFLGQIFPQFAFDPLFDISLALMAFLGGIGTLLGPLLGALVLEALQQWLTQHFSGTGTYLIAYGVLFLAVILLLPRGVVPTITELLAKRRARTAGAPEAAAEAPAHSGVAGVAP